MNNFASSSTAGQVDGRGTNSQNVLYNIPFSSDGTVNNGNRNDNFDNPGKQKNHGQLPRTPSVHLYEEPKLSKEQSKSSTLRSKPHSLQADYDDVDVDVDDDHAPPGPPNRRTTNFKEGSEASSKRQMASDTFLARSKISPVVSTVQHPVRDRSTPFWRILTLIAVFLAGVAVAIAVIALTKSGSNSTSSSPTVGASSVGSLSEKFAALEQEVAWLQANYTNLVNRKWFNLFK